MLVWGLSTSPDVQLATDEPTQAEMLEPSGLLTTQMTISMVSREMLESDSLFTTSTPISMVWE